MPEKIVYLEDEVKTFTENEKLIATLAINYFGGEQHPGAVVTNLHHYGRDFLMKCLEAVKKSQIVKDKGKKHAETLLSKMEAQPR